MDHYPGTEYPLTKKKKVRKEISLQKKKEKEKKSTNFLTSGLLSFQSFSFFCTMDKGTQIANKRLSLRLIIFWR